MMRKHTNKALRRKQVAARLNILQDDVPDLGRQWTRKDVLRLRRQRPDWLTDARRRLANERHQQRVTELARAEDLLIGSNFEPEYEDAEAAYLRADSVRFYLSDMGVPEDVVEEVVRRWYPAAAEV